jgi:hypothetical protein
METLVLVEDMGPMVVGVIVAATDGVVMVVPEEMEVVVRRGETRLLRKAPVGLG